MKAGEGDPAQVLAFLGERAGPSTVSALTHPSYANEHNAADYERLEFLGDSVLGLCVTQALMSAFPDASEGKLSLLRSQLVSTEALSAWGRALGVGKALRMGKGADQTGERERDSVIADAVEALVGAVSTDHGFEAARTLCAEIMSDALTTMKAQAVPSLDPKSELQQVVQAQGRPAPVYTLLGMDGPQHRRMFRVAVEVAEQRLGAGEGLSKKAAEQAAAVDALAGLPREGAPTASGEP